jgi:phosphoribosyl 1,2-cyclic phosphodiesterase
MSLDLCILASGSAGNCTVLRTPAGSLLIDMGIGPRSAAKRLEGTGLTLGEVSAICLTHLDRDHFNPSWLRKLIKDGIRLFCHHDCRRAVLAAADGRDDAGRFADLVQCFDGVAFEPLPGVKCRPMRFPHDEAGSHGFVFEGDGCRVGYATDLGRVPEELLNHFCGIDVLALESNYDPDMQLASPRPTFLKERIMGGHGHLSNEQAFAAIHRILNNCERVGKPLPSHIVLLHRSRQCNCPNLVRRFFSRDARIAARLTLAEQFARTEWLRPRAVKPLIGEQLRLAWA